MFTIEAGDLVVAADFVVVVLGGLVVFGGLVLGGLVVFGGLVLGGLVVFGALVVVVLVVFVGLACRLAAINRVLVVLFGFLWNM